MFDGVEPMELGRKIAGIDVRAMSDDELCTAAVVWTKVQSLISAGLMHVLAELEARATTDREFGSTTVAWVAREANVPKAVVGRDVKTARKLRALPEVDEALVQGRISSHHVRVVAEACNPRVADAVAAMQPALLEDVEDTAFEQWRHEVRDVVALADLDGGYDPVEDQAFNQVTISRTIDGITYLNGRFVGDLAERVVQGLESATDEEFRRACRDHETCVDLAVPERSNLRATALGELCRTGAAVDLHATRPPRPEVTLVVHAGEPNRVTGPTGVRLQDGTIRTLSCDADLFALVVDSLGQPLDMGRHVRRATAAQRRAIAARDGGCIFPGCGAPVSWCDAHHVEHFEHGGGTDTRNLALLCRRHHGVTHRKGWQMIATDDGWFYWLSPNGRMFWSERRGRRRTDPIPPIAA